MLILLRNPPSPPFTRKGFTLRTEFVFFYQDCYILVNAFGDYHWWARYLYIVAALLYLR